MATDRVGIEIELMGYDEAIKNMKNLENAMRRVDGFKVRGDAQKRLKELEANAHGLRSELERLRSAQAGVERGSDAWKSYADQMRQVRREMSQTVAEANRIKAAMRNVASGSQIFKRMTSNIAHVGSAMQSAGNAIQRFTTPFRMLTSGALLGAGFGAIGKIEEGLSSGFSRYDTMKKYPKIMAAFGYSAEQSKKSIDDLDKSVRGLPTGLDEMVDMSQRFTATTGDIDKGTKLAIAANNAFLASMSTDTQRYQGMMQLQDVLGGKKMNSREWNSLVSSMTPAIVKMGESMGYTNENMNEWIQKVRDGKVANDEFIDTLIKVANEGGEVAKMANESKDTWQAFSANVTNAFSRMTAGTIQSLDEIVKVATSGKFDSVNMLLADKVAPGIDAMTESIKNWIRANPDEIIGFANTFKSIDWKGLGKGFLDGIEMIGDAVEWVASKLEGKDLSKLGKFLFDLNILSSGLLIGGGLLKGFRHVFGSIGTGLTLLARGLGAVGAAKGVEKLGKLTKIFKTLGGIATAAEGAGAVGAASGIAKGAKFGGIFKGFLPIIEAIAGIGAITTEITAIAAIDTGLLSKAMSNIESITGTMQKVFDNVKGIKGEFTDGQAETLRTSVNNLFSIYDILYGEKKNAAQRTRGANKSMGGFGQQRDDGLGTMNKGKLAKTAEAMKSMVGVLQEMANINQMIPQLASFERFDESVTTGINDMIQSISSIAQTIDGQLGKDFDTSALQTKLGQIRSGIMAIKASANMLQELGSGALASTDTGAFTAIDNIKSMVSRLGESLNTDTLGSLREQVDSFKTAVQDIFTTLNGDFENVEVIVQIKGEVRGVETLVGEVNSAISKIRAAVRSIPNSITRHVYIHVTPHVDVGDYTMPTFPHTGGYIGSHGQLLYRSGGGGVGTLFKPKGTDTVPAMLTPGEYVQRKAAVDYFGIRFMQKLNNLDAAGAFRELSARIGSHIVGRSGTTIYNNITNNNPTVNQSINTNNPNFAFKRSNRYVMAL